VYVKKGRIVAALLCASAGFSSMAFAQNNSGWTAGAPDGRGGPNQGPANQFPANQGPANQRPLLGQNGAGQRDPRYQAAPGNDHRDNNGRPPMQQAQGGPNAGPHYAGPREWRRGDRLPNDYRNRQYVVDDYRGYGLHKPPRGYQWVGINGDFALVGIASGVIASIQLSNR
jgi:Ni/Co efflux regulator RcnB